MGLRSAIGTAFKWFFTNLEPLAVIIIAVTGLVLHLYHIVDHHVIAGITLAVLAALGFAILHDRHTRDHLSTSVPRLTSVVQSLSDRIDRVSADSFFSHETPEKPIVADAKESVLAIQETGSLLVEQCKTEVIDLLRSGRTVRMVVSAPSKPTANMMSLRNAGLLPEMILNRAKACADHVADIASKVGANAINLTIRYLPYPVDMTCVLVDSQHQSPARRKGLVRFAGFRVPFPQKLDFALTGASSPKIFGHYSDEAIRLYESAAKFVLVTGPPRSGKTTLFEKLSNEFQSPHLFYTLSPAIGDRNKRLGFSIITSKVGLKRAFATRKEKDEYEVDAKVMPLVVQELQEAKAQRKIIMLDEIGPLQLKHQAFVEFIKSCVDDPSVTLFATIAEDDAVHPLIPSLKRHHRSTVISISPNRVDQADDILRRELAASVASAQRGFVVSNSAGGSGTASGDSNNG